ncbi:MAG: DNA polymerase III subunit gamma/tau [Acidobacteriaceae bacterium]
MAYQVLARKYRPQRFADVIGQDHVTQTLLNALAQDRIAHGYIFSGHRGIGKTTIARILAMALQCRTAQETPERPTPEPCGACDACTEIRAGNAMDVIEIDAATNRGIDEIRELREGARYSPARDRYKIYILDEAHQITDAAFNALLKTLEEPPAHVIFMMATTQPEDIPQTIRSRCQHFSFHAVRFPEIVEQLRSIAGKESVGVDEGALSLLAEAGDGSMRDALSIMDQAIASTPLADGRHELVAAQIRALMGTVSNQIFEDMLHAVREHNAATMLQQAAQLLDAGNSAQQIARQMVRFLRNCLMARIAGTKSELLQVSEEERSRAERVAALFSEEDLARFLNSMLRTFDDLGYRQEQRFHLELGLLKLVHMQRLLPFEELFRQLSSGAGGSGPTAGARSTHAGQPPAATAMAQKSRVATATSKPFSTPPARSETAPVAPPEPNPELHPLDGMFGRTSTAAAAVPDKPAAASTRPGATPPVEPQAQSPADSEPSVASTFAAAPGPSLIDSETLRAEISAAMVQAGHETAGTLFEAGTWDWDGKELRIGIGASKTLLGLIYTAQAQQIVRDEFRKLTGSSRAVRVEPGEPGIAGAAKEATAPPLSKPQDGNERPQDHPLIRHAQQLFHAEVRSVVSLRSDR